MKVRLAYKCQLCGKLEYFGDELTMSRDDMKSLCNNVIQNQLFAGNPYLHKAHMHVLHNCSDNSVGIAVFAGVKVVG